MSTMNVTEHLTDLELQVLRPGALLRIVKRSVTSTGIGNDWIATLTLNVVELPPDALSAYEPHEEYDQGEDVA